MFYVQEKNDFTTWEDIDELADENEAIVCAVDRINELSGSGDTDYQTRVIDTDSDEVVAHYVIIPEEHVDLLDPPEWVAELQAALAKWDASDTGSGRLLAETLMAATVLTHREDILGVWGNE